MKKKLKETFYEILDNWAIVTFHHSFSIVFMLSKKVLTRKNEVKDFKYS